MSAILYTAAKGLLLLGSEKAVWMGPSDGVTDLTGNLLDLTENGTVTQAAVAADSALMGYSGYSAANYFSMDYDASFNPGTGDVRIRFLLKMEANSTTETVYERDSVSSAQRITVEVNAAGNLVFTCDDGTTVHSVTSAAFIDDGTWKYYECLYTAGTLYIYINASYDNSTTGTALLTLTNTSAVIQWGLSVAGTNPLTNGTLTLAGVGVSATLPTLGEMVNIYDSEEGMLHPETVFTIVGVVYSIDVDITTGTPSKKTIRNVTKTLDGSIKSLKHRDEHYMDVTLLPVERGVFDVNRRFLDSVDNGQVFSLDLYGTVAVPFDPINYKMESDGYTEGRIGVNHFQASFKAIKQ